MLIQQADTAIDAFHKEVPKFVQPQQQKILSVMEGGQDYTIGELAKLTGMQKSTVSGRRNAMLKDGLIEHGPERKCTISKITCETVRLPTPFQLEFSSASGFTVRQ